MSTSLPCSVALVLLLLTACSPSSGGAFASDADGGRDDAGGVSAIATDGGSKVSNPEATIPNAPNVRATVRVSGNTGPAGITPTPFVLDETLDVAPVTMSKLGCNAAAVTSATTSEEAVAVYLRICDGKVSSLVNLTVPVVAGSYPKTNSLFPMLTVQVGPASPEAPLLDYGSRRGSVPGTLEVSELDGVKAERGSPVHFGHALAKYTGTLLKGGECTGPTCATGGDAIDVELDVELTSVTSE